MNIRTMVGGILVLGILMWSGCATMQTVDNDEFKLIAQEILDQYSVSLLTEDLQLFESVHAEDMIKLMPGRPVIIGLEQEAQNKANAFKNGSFPSFDSNVEEAEVYKEIGFARGTVSYVFVPDSGKGTVDFSGKFLMLLKKDADGSWKIYRGCFNSP
jgi:ketosteroid isomerase-like protein